MIEGLREGWWLDSCHVVSENADLYIYTYIYRERETRRKERKKGSKRRIRTWPSLG